ncbi:hypothetical protein GN244_ATG09003 [Phytophthora infestans]|uniref:RxLR effector protein n=1 Tax=Phytophthora infestans TaxID=4787 RepID=A0A833S2R1_PHYIN|nr:hypothetical protein GN244_ATG09003 [Phytophthora infestans]
MRLPFVLVVSAAAALIGNGIAISAAVTDNQAGVLHIGSPQLFQPLDGDTQNRLLRTSRSSPMARTSKTMRGMRKAVGGTGHGEEEDESDKEGDDDEDGKKDNFDLC